MIAERHQGHDFTFVEINGKRAFDRYSAVDGFVVFIAGGDVGGRLETGVGKFRKASLGGGCRGRSALAHSLLAAGQVHVTQQHFL